MHRQFRWIGPFMAVLMLVGFGVQSSQASPSHKNPYGSLKGKSLVVASWGGAWTAAAKAAFGDPFSKATGVKVTYIASGNGFGPGVINQEKTGNVQWDMLDAGGSDTFVLHRMGYLATFPKSLVKEMKKTSRPGTVSNYNLDYGTTSDMIVCNPKIMKKCPTNPKQFWDVKHYPGPRAIVDEPDEAIGMALEASGVSPKHLFPMNINRAITWLKKIKPYVKVWPSSGAQQQQVIIDGEVGAAIMWNGRYFVTKRDSIHNLKGMWGGCLNVPGGLNVVKNSPDEKVAFAFLKWFVEHPKNQAQFTKAMSYPTPTKKLLKLVPKSIGQALPAAHHCTTLDGVWTSAHDPAIEKAWQQFLTG